MSVKKVFDGFYTMSDESFQEIEKRLKPFKAKRKEIMLQEESTCKHIYILTKGSMRSFHTHDDKEFTNWIYMEDEFVTSWYSFMLQQPSIESLQALEDLEGYTLGIDSFVELKRNVPEFYIFLAEFYELMMAQSDFMTKKSLTMGAKDKYDFVLQHFPKVLQRVSGKDLASILGISRETLSRIRGK